MFGGFWLSLPPGRASSQVLQQPWMGAAPYHFDTSKIGLVNMCGAIAYAAKTKGLHSNPKIPWGYRPSTPPAGATGGATDRKRKSVDEVSVLVTTTPRGSNYLGPGAPTNEGGIHLGGAENVRVSTALPDVAEAPAGAETGSTDIEANSN